MDDLFAGAFHPSTSSLVSTAAVVAGVPMKPEGAAAGGTTDGTISFNNESTRWQDKGRTGRSSRGEKDEIKKFKKMKIDKYDEFQEWVDGDATFRYRPKDLDARKHLSGWAMRNTNNHNKKVLKKSCLGVFLCSKNCHNNQGELVTVRPATSDRARRKQMEKSCPRPGCDGKLYHVACSGKNGYPVTHFWRVTDVVILFQSKGTHDHPRPDVVKTTSMAKMALLEYHRSHRHERPKEICRKVGVHLHKSFNRVDRVARQLREVQSGISKDDKEASATYPNMGRSYSLRSHVRGLFTSPQKASEAEQYGPQVQPYNGRHYGNYYPHQSHLETWSPYASPHEFTYSSYAPADHINALHANSYVGYAAAAAAGHPEFSQYEQMKIDYAAACGSNYLPGLTPVHEPYTTDTSAIANNPLDLVVSRNDIVASTTQPIALTTTMSNSYSHQDSGHLNNNTLLTPVSSIMTESHATEASPGRVENNISVISPATAATAPMEQSHPTNPLKRPSPPELQPLRAESKHLCPTKDNDVTTPSKKIKLKEHTPSINIDLTSFSDIFDIGAGLGEEGLAGRPKSPVYQNLSPVPETAPSVQYEKEPSETKPAKRPTHTHQHTSGDNADSRKHYKPSEPMLSPISSLKTVVTKPHDSPVFAQLSTHHQTTSSSNHEEVETNNYLDKLVSMYLSKDADKPISHLKNEFHVYTEKNGTTQLHSKALASYRQEQGHYSAHEFFRAASQYESWCNDRRTHGFRSPTGSASENAYPETGLNYDYHSSDHYSTDALSEQARYLYNGSGFTSPKYSRHQFLQNFGATVDK
ncbi:uncharacterized protein [Apostichopus japonicus]|uniref:uncharacterized protein isoform X2 n=1 Tax=Stichopus japonicus TaxID=307972 RepID=UPI003AB34235